MKTNRCPVHRNIAGALRTAAVTVSACIMALAGCRKHETAAPAGRPTPRVAVATAISDDVPAYLDEIGRTVSVEVVSIVPQVGGKIIATPVEDGAMVKKGELLFEIDPRPFEAALAAAKAALAQNRADLALAKIQVRRLENLITGGAVSQFEYDQAQSTVAVDQAKVEAAEAAVDTAKLNLEYTRIYAPTSGRAGIRMIDVGNVVAANGPPLLVIQQLDPIFAEFSVTENDLVAVRQRLADQGIDLNSARERGLAVQVSVPGGEARSIVAALAAAHSAAASTQPEMPARVTEPASRPAEARARVGSLIFMDNTVQPASGTIRLRAVLPNGDHYFWPGQFVNVRVILETKKDAIMIPAQAQQIGQQGPYVYVVKADQTAEIRPVTLGQRQGESLVIEKGLAAGERVIVTGQLLVVPGGKVEVVQ